MTTAKKLSTKKNLVLNAIKTLTTILFPLISLPYATRVLGKGGLGDVTYAESIVSYFALFAALGIVAYGTRELAKKRQDAQQANQLISELMLINVVTALIAYAALAVFIQLPSFNTYVALLWVQSSIILCNALGAEWYFTATENYLYVTVRAVIFQVLALIMLFCFVKTEQDVIFYAAVNIFATAGSGIINFFYLCRHVQFQPLKSLHLKQHIKPILIIFSTNLASTIYLNLDTVMLGYMINTQEVGLYTVAVRIVRAISMLFACISTVILPRVTYYLGQGQKDKFDALIYKTLNFILLLAIPSGLGLISISEPLVTWFGGSGFTQAYRIVSVLAFSVIFSALNRVFAWQILVPYNREKEVFYSTAAGAVVNFVLNLFFISRWGAVGAAATTVISEFVVFLMCTFQCRNVISYRVVYRYLWQYLLVAALAVPIAGKVVQSLAVSAFAGMVAQIVICVLLYGGGLLLLKNPLMKECVFLVTSKISRDKQ